MDYRLECNREYASSAGNTHMVSVVCVVVHPSRLAREGLKAILANSPFDPSCTSSSADEVPTTIASAGEQVLVLMGVRDVSTLHIALSAVKARFPDAPIVIVGDTSKRELVMAAITSEAASLVDENVPTSTLIKQLDLIAQGEPIISTLLLKRLLGPGPANPSQETVPSLEIDTSQSLNGSDSDEDARRNLGLSGREAAILNALMQGAPNKVIAHRLKITEATVKVHVRVILRKIKVRNRTQAAIWAMRHKVLPNPAKREYGEVALIEDRSTAG
jgi:two-component system, NarL family, nitrate/nitrite response regulator NarL